MAKGLDAERRKLAEIKTARARANHAYEISEKGKARRERETAKRQEARKTKPTPNSTTLTTEQLRKQYTGTLVQVRDVLKKQGIPSSIRDLNPVDSKGSSLWTDKQLRSTFYQWRLRNPTSPVTDFTFQHTVPQSKVTSIESALYAQHPKRLIGMTGPNTYDENGVRITTGNFGLKDKTNMQSLARTGVAVETGVRAGKPFLKGLPMITPPTSFIMEYLMAQKEKRPMNPLKALTGMVNIPYPGQQDPPMG